MSEIKLYPCIPDGTYSTYNPRTGEYRTELQECEIKETQMSKIPPRDWPKYKHTNLCPKCGYTHGDGRETTQDNHEYTGDHGCYISRCCHGCKFVWRERPLDFDFEKWGMVWNIEEGIDELTKELTEARKAVE